MEKLESIQSSPTTIKDFYELLYKNISNWSDFEEIQKKIVAIWIIGTYAHDKFISYPFLFLNAMKQSGKSRLLSLISKLAKRGKHITSLTEAVLFRLPTINKGITLCIDEVENINKDEKSNLRQLLQTGYKRGVSIDRMKKVAGEQVVEEFSVYTPVCLANITGLDDVLEDRCLTILLERSIDLNIVMKLEYYEYDSDIILFQNNIRTLVNLLNSINLEDFYKNQSTIIKNVVENINGIKNIDNVDKIDRVDTLVDTLLDTLVGTAICEFGENVSNVSNTTKSFNISNVSNVSNLILSMNDIENIIKTGIYGRNLELWIPIFILAKMIDEELLKDIIEYAGKTVIEKNENDLSENRDTIFLDFLYNNDQFHNGFIEVRNITEKYDNSIFSISGETSKYNWFNSKWVGRALRRHKLIIERRRAGNQKFIRLDTVKLNKLAKNLNLKRVEKETEPAKEKLEDFV